MKIMTTLVPALTASESLVVPFNPRRPAQLFRWTSLRPSTHRTAALVLSQPPSTMEQVPLIDSALKVICDNDVENGRYPERCQGLFASGDLEIAFAVVEAYPGNDLDVSLDRVGIIWHEGTCLPLASRLKLPKPLTGGDKASSQVLDPGRGLGTHEEDDSEIASARWKVN